MTGVISSYLGDLYFSLSFGASTTILSRVIGFSSNTHMTIASLPATLNEGLLTAEAASAVGVGGATGLIVNFDTSNSVTPLPTVTN